jgi:hypothetical protein
MIMQNDISEQITDYKNSANLYSIKNLSVYDLFNLYSNQSYYIENSILLLDNSYEFENKNDHLLTNVLQVDNNLNGNQYCTLLKSYDSEFYDNFQSDCDKFYKENLGLKDNIKIISAYIEANPPNFYDKNLTSQISLLSQNWTFVDDTQMYINQGILYEMDTLQNDIKTYINESTTSAIIRMSIYILLLVFEFFVIVYITRYLTDMLNKDKAILVIIPNEAISASEKVKMALRNLKNLD